MNIQQRIAKVEYLKLELAQAEYDLREAWKNEPIHIRPAFKSDMDAKCITCSKPTKMRVISNNNIHLAQHIECRLMELGS